MASAHSSREKSAFIAGVAAFTSWGLAPIYWKLLQPVPAAEILAHRFVWTWIFMALLLSWSRRWPEVRAITRSRRTTLLCVASGLAITINWFVFIWSVNNGQVLATSLGYFMTPLVSVLLGAGFLRERLTPLQFVSVLLATGALIYLTMDLGHLPWIALVLGISFGLYGLFRKISGAGPLAGLFLETSLVLPVGLGFLGFLMTKNTGHFQLSARGLSALLVMTGIVTGLPLLWFAHAARHLRLTTLGFLQYLAPSCTFCLGVFVFGEPFRRAQLITFSLIWIALALFTADAVARWRAVRPVLPATA